MIKRRLATRTETMQNQCFTAKITFIVAVVQSLVGGHPWELKNGVH